MLLNSTLRDPLVKAADRSTPSIRAETPNRAIPATLDGPIVPFARLPHALVGDHRLDPTARLIGAALLFWARDKPTATMSNASLARLLGLSLSVIERGLRALRRLGYVATEAVKAGPANLTGRVVHLRWVEDPAILPPVPDRRALEAAVAIASATEGAPDHLRAGAKMAHPMPANVPAAHGADHLTDHGKMIGQVAIGPVPMPQPDHLRDLPKMIGGNQAALAPGHGGDVPAGAPPTSRETPPARPERGGGAVACDGGRPSGATDKGDRPREKPENPGEAGAVRPRGRRRPQADGKGGSEGTPLRGTPAATIEINPMVAVPDEQLHLQRVVESEAGPTVSVTETIAPAPTELGELLTDGQLRALAAMTPEQRAAFEAKSPAMRAQILAPHAGGFDRLVFDGITRDLLRVPRFIAEARPVERTTPGLVDAVAAGDPRRVADLAEQLCRDFGAAGDRRRWGNLHALGGQLLAGVVSAEDLLDAHRQAMGPKAKNRGAVFTHALRRLGWSPEAKPSHHLAHGAGR